MVGLNLLFFDGFAVEWAGEPLQVFESNKARLLLAYLAIESNRTHQRENLAGLFWPESPESQAHHSLSQALSSLRKLFRAYAEDSLFEITPREVTFRGEAVWVDVREFLDLVQACASHVHDPSWACPACLDRLERAAALYSGDFLAGLALPDCQAFEEWLLLQRESFRHKLILAAGWLAQGFEALGELETALRYANRRSALDPLDEAAHRQMMHLLARLGRRSEAIARYHSCQKMLAEELDIIPEAETTALYQQIMMRAKDESPSPAVLHNLPPILIPVVGRQTEIEHLRQKLFDPTCRLVTVLGPGGAGKTCLALEVARSMLPFFSDGVFLVNLDTQQSSQVLLPSIARAAGLVLRSDLDHSLGSYHDNIQEQVCGFLQDRRLLLILDGFEGLLSEASIIGGLLQRLPGLKILATSRARLNLAIEQVFPLGGLAYPAEAATENPDSYSSVQLFLEAARRVYPAYALNESERRAAAEICRLNQGIPLGILLAAAWVDVLPAKQIVSEIQQNLDFLAVDWPDLPDRQRSLRATFDHSWRLLSDNERSVFLRLAVLHGEFSIGRAQQMMGASLDVLKALVEQSLLQRVGPDRFRMHDLLRQYAQEKLAATPAENIEIHLRYCRIYLEALAAWEPRLKSAEQIIVLQEIDREYADILAAWEWAVARQQADLLDRAVEALGCYLHLRGMFTECALLCQRVMARLEAAGITPLNLRLWVRLGIWQVYSYWRLHDAQSAWPVIRQIEEQMKKWGEPAAGMRRERAMLHLATGDVAQLGPAGHLQAITYFQQGLELMLAGEDPWDISFAQLKNSVAYGLVGDIRKMGWFAKQALATQRPLGDVNLLSWIYAYFGYYYMLIGDYEAALHVVEEQVANLKKVNTHYSQGIAKDHLALALFYAGQYEQARQLYTQVIPYYSQPEEMNTRRFDQFILTCIYLLTGDYAAVLKEAAYSGEALDDFDRDSLALFKGQVHLISADWDQAEQELNRNLSAARSQDRPDMAGQPLALLGFIAYRRGNLEEALDTLTEGLDSGVENGFYWVLILSLSVLALILAESRNLEQAVELITIASAHPSARNSRWFEDVFVKPLAQLTAGLPAETFAAAQARGQAQNLTDAGQEALNRLKATPGSLAGFTNLIGSSPGRR